MRRGLLLWTGTRLDANETVAWAIAAEQAGWHGVFVPDELSAGYSDPWTVLAAVATRTEHIRLGTWITPVPHQQPWRLAHALAALDQLSGGRVIMGAGLGAPTEHRMFGGDYEPRALGRKYDEALEIITRLWSGTPFDFDGEFFTLRDATISVTPVQQPRIPILMGCWWPNKKPFRRAAQFDGIMPFWPALMQEGSGPQGEEPTGSTEEELKDLVAYYRSITDRPGEILVPDRGTAEYRALAAELGVTWLLELGATKLERVRAGPPS